MTTEHERIPEKDIEPVGAQASTKIGWSERLEHPLTSNIVCSVIPKMDSNLSMKAACWEGAKNCVLKDVYMPLITDDNDAIVKVTTTTICGSDLHLYAGEVKGKNVMQKNDILGHEAVGIIESVGPSVKNFKKGQRVVISALICCGNCEFCQKQQFSLCDCTNPSKELQAMYGTRLAGVFGYSHLLGGFPGLQSEVVRVPLADMTLLPIPDNITDEKALVLSDIFCTGWHGTELANVQKGDTVLIFGAGPVGHMAALAAKIRGAKQIVNIDQHQNRLDSIKKNIGTDVLNFNEVDIREEIYKMWPLGADCSIECAGFRFPQTAKHKAMRATNIETDSPEIIDLQVYLTKKGGHMALIGDYFGYCNDFPIGPLMEKNIHLQGGQVFVQKYWKHLMQLIQSGQVDPTFVFTHEMPFEEISNAYKLFYDKPQECVKILLRTKNYHELRTEQRKEPQSTQHVSELQKEQQQPLLEQQQQSEQQVSQQEVQQHL